MVANPDYIITDDAAAAWQQRWQQWRQLTAVAKGNLYAISPALLERAGPRLVQGVRQLCEILHGKAKS